MARRPLPDAAETAAILARKRSRPPHRPPRPAGRSLAKFVKALDERFGKGADGLKARWREVVGEMIAMRSEPVRLIKGRAGAGAALEVKVDGPAATLIQHQAQEILERVNLMLGAGAVERLRIVQGPVRPAAQVKAAPGRRPKPPPLDAAREAALRDSMADAPDGPLKAALVKLGREVMRRNPPRGAGRG